MKVSLFTADVSLTAKAFFASQGFIVTEARPNVIIGHPAPNFTMAKQLWNAVSYSLESTRQLTAA